MINAETAKELTNKALLEKKRQYETKLNNYVEELGEIIKIQAKLGLSHYSICRTHSLLKDDIEATAIAKKISERGFDTKITQFYLEISWE